MIPRWCASESAASTCRRMLDDAPERERALLVLDAREVLAAQELHDEIELAVLGLAEVDDGDGVRMIEPARRARLGDEARGRVLFTDEVRVDDLDRDGSAEVRLLGAVDAAHAADPDEVEDDVAARKRAADERIVRAAARPSRRGSRTMDRTCASPRTSSGTEDIVRMRAGNRGYHG